MLEQLLSFDHALFQLINTDEPILLLDSLLCFWRNKYNWIPLYALLALFFVWKYRWRALFIFLIIGLAVLLADQLSSELIKKSVMRLRPCNNEDLQVRLLVHCGSGYSFTSSHATNHFALASLFSYFIQPFFLKRKWLVYLWFFIWAGLVAYAQVYVGVHFPLDVFAGAFLGLGISGLLLLIFKTTFPNFFIDAFKHSKDTF